MQQPGDQQMQDTEQKRRERKAPRQVHMAPPPGHNRKDRRRWAKKHGLFKDHTGEVWQKANAHMKARNQQREVEQILPIKDAKGPIK